MMAIPAHEEIGDRAVMKGVAIELAHRVTIGVEGFRNLGRGPDDNVLRQ